MRSVRTLLATRRDMVHLLDRAASSPSLYLQESVLLLRDMFDADTGIMYRTARCPLGVGHELELCHQVGMSSAQMMALRRLFTAGSPIYGYNPEDPEPEQRNRVVSLSNDRALDSTKLRRADRYFRQHGSTVYGQHRVLLFDGIRFLARVGVARQQALTKSEHRAFESLIPHFVQTLRIERALSERAVSAAGLTAALDKLEGAWFITTETGRIEYGNAAATKALAADNVRTRAELVSGIARRHDQPGIVADVSELRSEGQPKYYLVGLRGLRCAEQRLNDAQHSWKLTPRQTQILSLVAAGEPNKVIADRLGCAERTVEAHVTQLLRASGTAGRTALVASFWRLG